MGSATAPDRVERGMRDAGAYLDQPEHLRRLLKEDGYLFLRGVLDEALVVHARGLMIDALVEQELLPPEAATRHAEGEIDTRWTGRRIPGVGLPGKQEQTAFLARRIWEDFVETASVRSIFDGVFGGPVRFFPLSEYRTAGPGWFTPIHQDGWSNYGYDIHTAWFPMMPIDARTGGLGVLARTPGRPYPPLVSTSAVPLEVAAEPGWLSEDYLPGDMVIFAGDTMHCGLVNKTADRLRLSFEVRFQGPDAPRPIFGRIVEISTDALTVEEDGGGRTTLAIDDKTFLRGDRVRTPAYELIDRFQLAGSELEPGFPVIIAHRDGVAISVRGIFY